MLRNPVTKSPAITEARGYPKMNILRHERTLCPKKSLDKISTLSHHARTGSGMYLAVSCPASLPVEEILI